MNDIPNISKAEWNIIKLLWEESPLTSSEIINRIDSSLEWNSKTIHTLISRLVKKGFVNAEKQSHHYLYYAVINEAECKITETHSFLDRVFNGSVKLMLSSFIKDETLSHKDILELQQMLESKLSEDKK